VGGYCSFATRATVTVRIEVYTLLAIMFLNSSSSAVRQRVSNDGESGGTKRQRELRGMNASIRCRSAAVVNPNHALDAYCSFAMTTERNIFCSAVSFILWLRKTLRAQSVCAHELIVVCTCSVTDIGLGLLFVIVTLRILTDVTRSIPGNGMVVAEHSLSGACQQIQFPCILCGSLSSC